MSDKPAVGEKPAILVAIEGLIHDPGYAKYWKAWGILLALTLVMVAISNPVVLLTGIAVKAAIILFVFMHLRSEHAGLILCVLLGAFATSFVLFGLIVPDGLAM